MTWMILLGILLAGAIVAAQVSSSSPADEAAMGRSTRLVIMSYLLALAAMLVYGLVKLSALEYPDAPLTIQAQGDKDMEALSKLSGPVLFYAMPHLTPGSPATYELALYGKGFKKDLKVRLNGDDQVPKFLVADNLVRIVPENKVLVGTNVVVAEVVNADGGRSNALMLRIDRPKQILHFLDFEWPITRDLQLLLMVLCAGALGTFVHAVGSLADYIGNQKTISSWFWWYITRPFLGATMALIFYAVLRGGFLTGTAADVRVVNPFGAIAVAALVGMFSDKASLKLKEIFDTLFKSDDKRTGKLAGPVVTRLNPATVRSATGQPLEIKILGDRLGKTTAVKVNGAERKPDAVSEKEVTLKLTVDDTKNAGQVKISVVTPDGASADVVLQVSDLAVTTAALPQGSVGVDYAGQVQATGGSQPLQWSMDNAPDGLKIDAKSGGLKGKPTAAGTTKTTVKVTDKDGASATRDYDVEIVP